MLETRFAEGANDRFLELARGLQQAKVRIILPNTIAGVRGAQQLESPNPAVMPGINDPVGTGLIASLARPGGHTTGVSTDLPPLTAAGFCVRTVCGRRDGDGSKEAVYA